MDQTAKNIARAVQAKEQLLTEKEVAQRWSFLTEKKLRNLRYRRLGPKYLKFGENRNGRVFYMVADIEAWIQSNYQLDPYYEGMVKTPRVG